VKILNSTLGGALRQKRWQHRLEQNDVARILGVSKDTYRLWETNRRRPGRSHVTLVQKWLGS